MEYIYESPDNGKTIYRRPINDQDAERELIQSPISYYEGQKILEVIISDDGQVVINDFEKGG